MALVDRTNRQDVLRPSLPLGKAMAAASVLQCNVAPPSDGELGAAPAAVAAEGTADRPSRKVKRGRPLGPRDTQAGGLDVNEEVFLRRLQNGDTHPHAPVLRRKKSLTQMARAWVMGEAPPLPGNADAMIATFRGQRIEAGMQNLKRDLAAVALEPEGGPKAHHFLKAICLQGQAEDPASRTRAEAAVAWVKDPKLAQSCTYTAALPVGLPAFKFAQNPRLAHKARVPQGELRVREAFSSLGYMFITNSLFQGGFGKFRTAMDLQGKCYAVKEFRTAESREYAPGAYSSGKAKTNCTEMAEIKKEIADIRLLSPKIQLFGDFMWRGKYYLFMELLKGDAQEVLLNLGDQAKARAMVVATRDVLRQLDVLHTQHKMVHCDLKWSNVLVGEDGHFHLADFGMTERLGPNGVVYRAAPGGTHFAPETLVPSSLGFPFTPAADIFCLGVSTAQMYLPSTETPFELAGYPGGRVGLRRDVDGFRNYAKWHKTILGPDKKVDLDKIAREGLFGGYFAKLRDRAPRSVVEVVLGSMLVPYPQGRRTAAQIAKMYDTGLTPQTEATIYREVKDAPSAPAIRQASDVLERYRRVHAIAHRETRK